MRIDLLEQLSRQMLERWRQRRETEPAEPAAAAAAGYGTVTWGEISNVVTSDPEVGPHLQAVPVRFEGTPPTPQALAGPVFRCHPSPGKQVSDYSVGEVVKVFHASGANIAEKTV